MVHLITSLEIGGAEMMLTRLLERFDPVRLEHHVVTLGGIGVLGPEIAARGVRVTALGMRSGRGSPGSLVRLVRMLRSIRPHVLQTWLYHADLAGLIASALTRDFALVWNIRCSELNFAEYSRTLRSVVRALAVGSRRPAAVVCNSSAGRRAHEAMGYRPRQWVLIPNGVDTTVFQPSEEGRRAFRRELGLDEQASLVGLVGRLHPMKDHRTFMAAAAIVARQDPTASFVAIGRDVGDSRLLHELVRDLGLGGRVRLLGERRDIARVVPAFDVAISSSSSEGFPNTVIEAMACGIPCVATDVGDSAVIVADTGIVVPPRDPAALADGMLRMLTRHPAARAALGRAARARVVREYSIDSVAERHQVLYEQLAQVRTGPVDEPCAG